MKDQIYPKVRKDCYFNDLFVKKNGKGQWVVGCVSEDSQMLIQSEKVSFYKSFFDNLDGTHSIEDLFQMGYGTCSEINKMIDLLSRKGLLEGGKNERRFNEADTFSLRLVQWKQQYKSDYIRSVCNKLVVLYIVLLIFFTMILPVIYIYYKPTLSISLLLSENTSLAKGGLENGLSMYIMVALGTPIMFVIHEIAHMVTAIRYKLKEGTISIVLFLGFIPMVYIRQRALYSLPKRQIIKVLISGIAANLLFAIVFFNLFILTNHEIYEVLALANVRMIYVNLIPLSLTDGYFILGLIFKIPNIRFNMYRLLAKPTVVKKCSMQEILMSSILLFVIIIILNVEVIWLLTVLNVKSKFVILAIFDIGYLFMLHLISKKKIMSLN